MTTIALFFSVMGRITNETRCLNKIRALNDPCEVVRLELCWKASERLLSIGCQLAECHRSCGKIVISNENGPWSLTPRILTVLVPRTELRMCQKARLLWRAIKTNDPGPWQQIPNLDLPANIFLGESKRKEWLLRIIAFPKFFARVYALDDGVVWAA